MYSSYPIEPEQLVSALLHSFEEHIPDHSDHQHGNRPWTVTVQSALRHLGEERGMQVRCSDGTKGHGEFLVDILWFDPSGTPKAAFESEWGGISAVEYDFKKLLCIKAPLKVMICDCYPEPLIGSLEQCIRRYPDHLAGERYLVLNVCGSAMSGNPKCHMWEAPKAGSIDSPTVFSEILGSPFTYTLRPRQ